MKKFIYRKTKNTHPMRQICESILYATPNRSHFGSHQIRNEDKRRSLKKLTILICLIQNIAMKTQTI